jgi:hypothetical protein
MIENADGIECVALDLIARFGDFATLIARELGAVSGRPVYFVLCAPFSMPLALVWPLTDCSKYCRMQCGYANFDNESTELKKFKRFRSDTAHISCKLVEIIKERQHNPHSTQIWRDIADAIERLSLKP